jgi:hypothetical protein
MPRVVVGGGKAAAYKGGIKGYWKRRGYDRLDAAAAQPRPRLPTAELGGGGEGEGEAQPQPQRHRRRGWRVRRRRAGVLGRRLLRALSPLRLLARLRDAYVNAMLRLASSAAVVGYGASTGPYCTAAADPFNRPRPLTRDYDEKALVEIYRSILARGGEAGPVPVLAAARLPAAV